VTVLFRSTKRKRRGKNKIKIKGHPIFKINGHPCFTIKKIFQWVDILMGVQYFCFFLKRNTHL